MMYYGYGAGIGVFGLLLNVLSWALIIMVIVAVVRSLKRGGHWRQCDHESARDILAQRYAKGEITKQQFEEMKKDLGS